LVRQPSPSGIIGGCGLRPGPAQIEQETAGQLALPGFWLVKKSSKLPSGTHGTTRTSGDEPEDDPSETVPSCVTEMLTCLPPLVAVPVHISWLLDDEGDGVLLVEGLAINLPSLVVGGVRQRLGEDVLKAVD
jgi:hypothetical protein